MLALGITRLIEPSETAAGSSSQVVIIPVANAASTILPDIALPVTANYRNIGPQMQNPENMQLTLPTKENVRLQENGRIDAQFFSTTVFVGDSITQGLPRYLPYSNYCAYIGASPRSIYSGQLQQKEDGTEEDPMQAILNYAPENIYILLGTNALVSLSVEAVAAYYAEMIDTFKAQLPEDVDIYIQSVTPVMAGYTYTFNPSDIPLLNDALVQLAYEKDVYYVDISEVLADENGWLKPEYGAEADGYHLQPIAYRAWVEYLITHTAYNPRHAYLYLEGSPYYM